MVAQTGIETIFVLLFFTLYLYNIFAYEQSYVLFMEDLACLNLFMDFLVDK